jgi:hypothetical protein
MQISEFLHSIQIDKRNDFASREGINPDFEG